MAALPWHPPCETQTSEMGHAPRSCWLRTLHLFSGPPSGITPTQFWRYTPPAVPPALPGTQHPLAHMYVPPSGPSRPTKAGSGDIKDGLKLQEFPSSTWATLRPAWYFNNLASFLNNPHSPQLKVLRNRYIQCCPSVSAGGPVALPSPSAPSNPDVRHHPGV